MTPFDDDETDGLEGIDPALMQSLEMETPILMRLRKFASTLGEVNWFAHLGERPAPIVGEASSFYLDRLGFPDAELAILPTWEDAADAAETLDWASPAWEAEELARADLTAKALSVLSEEALEVGLKMVAQSAGDAAKMAMEEQASLWDMDEAGPRDLAVGAAAQASHSAALLLAAAVADPDLDGPDHLFTWKLRLFQAGRWPVALVGGSFSVF